MRSKEEAHDYRYFPDPDLLPLKFDDALVQAIASDMPELPDAKRTRFIEEYDLSEADATLLVEERETAEFYEEMAAGRDKKLSANWLGTELFGALNKEGLSLAESPITAESLGRLIELISDGTISGRIAKDVFVDMFESGEDALDIVERKGLTQISDAGAILELVESVISDNASKVAEFRNGKDKLFGFFVGQVMKKSQGKANPKLVNNLLKDKLG